MFFFVLIISVGLIVPFRVCFVENDPIGWTIYDYCTDFFFSLDLILNFFSAYYAEDKTIVTNYHQIAKNYLTGWFIIDFIALIPIYLIF